jgi:carotenoid cleavage dioxygenase
MGSSRAWEQLHRREALRLAGGALLALGAAPLLAACGGDGGGGGATAASDAGTTVPLDPSKPWWLQRGFAPVTEEVSAEDLAVTGALPRALDGLYVRNGSNPRTGTSPHWFLGDGMVHGVRLERGRARWYRNRYVRTPLYEGSQGFGEGVPGGTNTQSNVSAIWHADRLLTSGEVGLPYELSPEDLSTRGPHDFAGSLATSMTAHPKIDPSTGAMHFFGYGFVPPFLTYHVADAGGRLVHSTEVPVKGPTMIHDFAITETDVVFWELPVVFDLDAAIAMVNDPGSTEFPFRWDPAYGARVGVLPLGGAGSAIRWCDLDEPCYVFHGVNAYRSGDEVVVDVCRHATMFEAGTALGSDLSVRRWHVDTGRQRVRDEVVDGERPGELPSRDLRRTGREHRYAYYVDDRRSADTVDLGGVIKRDHRTGEHEVWDPGPTRHGGEWLFVADDGATGDDEGWLLGYVHDEATGTTELTVLDATDVPSGPVASVALPQRVPYGFHAAWVPA